MQLPPPFRRRVDPQRQRCRIALGRVTTFAQFAQIICDRAQPQLVFGKIDAHIQQSLLGCEARFPPNCRCLGGVVELLSFLGKDVRQFFDLGIGRFDLGLVLAQFCFSRSDFPLVALDQLPHFRAALFVEFDSAAM